MYVCAECGLSQPSGGPCPVDGTLLAPVGDDVLLGTTIGAYRVSRLLGIGGMGRVYKGVHPVIGSRVAIKVLSRECSDRRDLVERFFSEARAINLIRHESIVNVLDLATLADGRPYIIMEYLDGAPLAALVDHAVQHRAPLPLGGLARLISEVLEALAAAHAKGVIHRDLKPDNVFVAPSGRTKVLDFGIAKLSDVGNTATRTGSLLGTPHYMSPEQAAGRVVDHRTDLYAIGVILFECATGQKPFHADALFDLLRLHIEVPPPSPRVFRPDMPHEFEQVILTALAKPLDQRFASATAMNFALQHAAALLPPDQWRTLTPPIPAPPAGRSAASSGATPGSQQPIGNASTVSAGQVGPSAWTSARRRWVAAAAVTVVGGGIAAATMLGRGGGGARRHGATVSAVAPPSGTAEDPWAAAGESRTATGSSAAGEPGSSAVRGSRGAAVARRDPPEGAGSDSEAPAGDGNDDDADEDTPPVPPVPGKSADPFAQLDLAIQALPAAQQKRFATYRGLAKLPAAERTKRLRQLVERGLADLDLPDPAAITRAALASVTKSAAPTPEAPLPPPPPAAPPVPATAWITNHRIEPPHGYDPARVDVAAFIPWAIAQARKAIPDAQLIRIDASGVGPDGRADLHLATLASTHGDIDLRFISPSRGKRDPRQPLGAARHDFKCEFRIMAEPDGVMVMPIDFADCSKERVVPAPRCSSSSVWKKAIAHKAPSSNAVANLGYRANGARPVWYFDIGFGRDVAFSNVFGDDC